MGSIYVADLLKYPLTPKLPGTLVHDSQTSLWIHRGPGPPSKHHAAKKRTTGARQWGYCLVPWAASRWMWLHPALSSHSPSPHLFQLFQAGCCLGKLLIRFLQPARRSYGKQWEIIPCMGKCLCSGQNVLFGEPSCIAFVSGWFEGNVEALTMQKINSYLSVCLPTHACVKGGNCQTWNTEEQGRFYTKLLSGWRRMAALTLRGKAEKIVDPCTGTTNQNGKKKKYSSVGREQNHTAWTLNRSRGGRQAALFYQHRITAGPVLPVHCWSITRSCSPSAQWPGEDQHWGGERGLHENTTAYIHTLSIVRKPPGPWCSLHCFWSGGNRTHLTYW